MAKKSLKKQELSSVLRYKIHFAEVAVKSPSAVKPPTPTPPADDPYKTAKPELCYTAVSICQPVFWFEDTTSAVVSCN